MRVILDDGIAREIKVEKALIEEILNAFHINPEEVIVAKNGRVVSEDDYIEDGDEMKVVRIIHGG